MTDLAEHAGLDATEARELTDRIRGLLALLDRAPEATTVGQAAQVLGTDVGSYLAKPEERAA